MCDYTYLYFSRSCSVPANLMLPLPRPLSLSPLSISLSEGAVAQNAVVIGGSTGVRFSSLTFRHLGGFALYAANTAHLVVERVAALDVGSGGLFIRACPGALVNNSIVRGYVNTLGSHTSRVAWIYVTVYSIVLTPH